MISSSSRRLLLALATLVIRSHAFTIPSLLPISKSYATNLKQSTSTEDGSTPPTTDDTTTDQRSSQREAAKKKMLQLGASYDRGFGASPNARKQVEDVIAELELLNDETDAARGIDGTGFSPMEGNWRMVWCTASDVLILGANPLLTVGAIYQIYEPPIVTNVIDLIPRVQNLFPPNLAPSSLLRAEVQTRSSPRADYPMRVGLDFEAVSLKPVEFLGQDAGFLPPLGFDLPRVFELPDDVGYFDVTFLDDELVIIKQNAPGGLFVLARVDDASP
eukprot:CAMPEP_0198253686 /NCGR_PEP_ID=MMETSP1447-20131203/4088_1 /TAXON_ID=420782 /ORGANISM="Chaetoceros dichaeta, Strain CCMP1751" /LENGTH=274 /DNA_ID=CAMNT_0043939463 /DNA_START=55 /DNA_END=879 /DNA_ORIENTATION=-